jgi:hypothetical protein
MLSKKRYYSWIIHEQKQAHHSPSSLVRIPLATPSADSYRYVVDPPTVRTSLLHDSHPWDWLFGFNSNPTEFWLCDAPAPSLPNFHHYHSFIIIMSNIHGLFSKRDDEHDQNDDPDNLRYVGGVSARGGGRWACFAFSELSFCLVW